MAVEFWQFIQLQLVRETIELAKTSKELYKQSEGQDFLHQKGIVRELRKRHKKEIGNESNFFQTLEDFELIERKPARGKRFAILSTEKGEKVIGKVKELQEA